MAAKDLGHILNFSIALRPDGDNRLVDRSDYGETHDRIIKHYNLPIPSIIDLDVFQQPGSAPEPFVPGQAPATPAPTPDPEASPEASPEAAP